MVLPGDVPKIGYRHECLKCGHVCVLEQEETTCRKCHSIYISKMPVLVRDDKDKAIIALRTIRLGEKEKKGDLS